MTSIVYVCVGFLSLVQRYTDWQQKFGQHLGKKVVMLTGETSVDLRLLRDVKTTPSLPLPIALPSFILRGI